MREEEEACEEGRKRRENKGSERVKEGEGMGKAEIRKGTR